MNYVVIWTWHHGVCLELVYIILKKYSESDIVILFSYILVSRLCVVGNEKTYSISILTCYYTTMYLEADWVNTAVYVSHY